MKNIIINVLEKAITVKPIDNEHYICLTDMVKGVENGQSLIEKWLRNKNTIEFMGLWETLHNSDFDTEAFHEIMAASGLNRFVMSARQWIDTTGAIGLIAQAGRYGGTYAQKDIAFEFGSWINPKFKLFLIQEYQNLQNKLADPRLREWDVKRILSKANYVLQTDAVQEHIVGKGQLWKRIRGVFKNPYATEADIINLVVFGVTAGEWRQTHPDLHKKGLNMRDAGTINQLVVLSNMEAYNSELIKRGVSTEERKHILFSAAKEQISKFNQLQADKKFSKLEHLKDPRLLK